MRVKILILDNTIDNGCNFSYKANIKNAKEKAQIQKILLVLILDIITTTTSDPRHKSYSTSPKEQSLYPTTMSTIVAYIRHQD